MKVNPKILSIPPYISTAWKNVLSLHVEHIRGDTILMIGLVNSSIIEIPNLDPSALEAIFQAHEKHLEQEASNLSSQIGQMPISILPGNIEDTTALLNLPLRLGLDPTMGNLLQHNPEAANSPDLPKEILEKIAHLSKVVDFENNDNLLKPEPHCNCMHCQIMRVIQDRDHEEKSHGDEEEVSVEDLRFRDWEIEQTGDQLYILTNPLNGQEQYTVFLGNPVGCTCGQLDCEHIRSVLNS